MAGQVAEAANWLGSVFVIGCYEREEGDIHG